MTDFTRYQGDPVAFVREVLGGDPWERQVEILEAVRDHERVTVRSCHGVGKTYVAACALLWRLHAFRPSIVLTTAPGHRQVKDILWRQIRALQKRARVSLPGEVRETAIKLAEDTFALGFATDEGDRFQGFHGRHLFIVVEEAAGVPDGIYEAIDACLTSEGSRLLLIGNPTRPTGRFAASFRAPGWKRIRISAFDSPNVRSAACALDGTRREWPEPVRPELVSVRWVVERGEEWGLNSPIYQARVLGDFPDASDDALIPLTWIEAAARRAGMPRAFPPLPGLGAGGQGGEGGFAGLGGEAHAEIGLDVARFGDCETVAVVRRGEVVTRIEAWRGADLMATTGRVADFAREAAAGEIRVDAVGMGGGVADRLRELARRGELSARITEVNGGERPRDRERFERRRDELFWALRERFRRGEIVLSDERTAAQLALLRYRYTSAGRLEVESKEELRARGVPSPDRADALALAFAPAPLAPRLHVAAGSVRRAS
jgi:phage terminase large subunit